VGNDLAAVTKRCFHRIRLEGNGALIYKIQPQRISAIVTAETNLRNRAKIVKKKILPLITADCFYAPTF